MTLFSIVKPRWISWDSETVRWLRPLSQTRLRLLSTSCQAADGLISVCPQPSGQHIHYIYGLHRRCNSITNTCEFFPKTSDCHGDRYFCSMWRSVGFLMSFGVVIEGMALIAFIVVISGGKQKRENGWKVISGLLVLAGLIQCAGMAIIVSHLSPRLLADSTCVPSSDLD